MESFITMSHINITAMSTEEIRELYEKFKENQPTSSETSLFRNSKYPSIEVPADFRVTQRTKPVSCSTPTSARVR